MLLLKANNEKVLGSGGKGLSVEAGEGRQAVAFAIYSEDDYSLIFYGTDGYLPTIGEKYNNKTVTNIYTGFDNDVYSSSTSVPWYSVRSNILTVSFDTSFATIRPVSTAYWFYYFENCSEIQTKYLNTKSVTNIRSMFVFCKGLTSLDVTSFDTSNVTNMVSMFDNCSGLTTIYSAQNQFNIDKVISSTGMFQSCSNLVGGNGTTYDYSKVNASMAHVDTASDPGYFTAK